MKARFLIIIPLVLSFSISCSNSKNREVLDKKFCYTSEYQDLSISFKEKHDTIFFYYFNIVDSGQYINGYSDDDDYAGFFQSSQLKGKFIHLEIKNYRMPEFIYNLEINVKGNDTILWKINENDVSYLPKEAILIPCK